jgi:hypothetical protein
MEYPFIVIRDCIRWIVYTGNRIKIHPETSVPRKPRVTLNKKWKKQLSGYSPIINDDSFYSDGIRKEHAVNPILK